MKALELLNQIDALLDDDAYIWAFDTLSGIRASIISDDSVTEGRVRAIENIRNAVTPQQRSAAIGTSLPSDKYRTSRRYEGYVEDKKRGPK